MTKPARALVTGGTSGIGAAVVRRLTGDGAEVVFTGRNDRRAKRLASATGAAFVRADARDSAAVSASIAEALSRLGGLDALVLSAGVIHPGPLAETSDEAWDDLIETNVLAPYLYATGCLRALRKGSSGSIVAIVSGAAEWPDTASAAYAVSKRALLALARMLAVEAAPSGVRVNAVSPGDTDRGMATSSNGAKANGRGKLPLPPSGRRVKASEVAGAVAYLLSEDASSCNGTTLTIDGGMRASSRAWAVSNGS